MRRGKSRIVGTTNSMRIEHVYNIPTMHCYTWISRHTELKSDIYAIGYMFALCYHWLSVSGISKIMHCEILINMPWSLSSKAKSMTELELSKPSWWCSYSCINNNTSIMIRMAIGAMNQSLLFCKIRSCALIPYEWTTEFYQVQLITNFLK